MFTTYILLHKNITLNLTRIKRPYFDVNMLAELFYRNTQSRKVKFHRLISLLLQTVSLKYDWNRDFKKSSKNVNKDSKGKKWNLFNLKTGINHDSLKGFRIKLGGRLLSQKIIPRISSKTYIKGQISRGKVHFANTARVYNKHKRGAYSITITTTYSVLKD